MQGLLGSHSGQATDFQLPNGTVLAQPLSDAEILGVFADAWRVAPGASLLDDTHAPAAAPFNPAVFVQAMAADLVSSNATSDDPGVPAAAMTVGDRAPGLLPIIPSGRSRNSIAAPRLIATSRLAAIA